MPPGQAGRGVNAVRVSKGVRSSKKEMSGATEEICNGTREGGVSKKQPWCWKNEKEWQGRTKNLSKKKRERKSQLNRGEGVEAP